MCSGVAPCACGNPARGEGYGYLRRTSWLTLGVACALCAPSLEAIGRASIESVVTVGADCALVTDGEITLKLSNGEHRVWFSERGWLAVGKVEQGETNVFGKLRLEDYCGQIQHGMELVVGEDGFRVRRSMVGWDHFWTVALIGGLGWVGFAVVLLVIDSVGRPLRPNSVEQRLGEIEEVIHER